MSDNTPKDELKSYNLDWLSNCTAMAEAAMRRFNEDFSAIDRIIGNNKTEFPSESDAETYVRKVTSAFVDSVNRTKQNLTELNVAIVKEMRNRHPSLTWPFDRKDDGISPQKCQSFNILSQNKTDNDQEIKAANFNPEVTSSSKQNFYPLKPPMLISGLEKQHSYLSGKIKVIGNCYNSSNVDSQYSSPSRLTHFSPTMKLTATKARKFKTIAIVKMDSDNVMDAPEQNKSNMQIEALDQVPMKTEDLKSKVSMKLDRLIRDKVVGSCNEVCETTSATKKKKLSCTSVSLTECPHVASKSEGTIDNNDNNGGNRKG